MNRRSVVRSTRWHQFRVRRQADRVESVRDELALLDDTDPIARLELLYRLADETEKLDRLTPP